MLIKKDLVEILLSNTDFSLFFFIESMYVLE